MRHCLLLVLFLTLYTSTKSQLPEDFSIQNVNDGWDGAVGIEFFNDSIYFVYERTGKVYQVINDEKITPPVIDISEEVGSWGDMGMLGMALHPNFKNNGQIFLSYCVDRHHLIYSDSSNYNPSSNDYYSATIGRVTRYTIDTSDYKTLKPESRKILIGDSIHNGIPSLSASHLVGSLVFGKDTSLLVATGDGNTFVGYHVGEKPYPDYAYDSTAIANNIITPKEHIGSYRAQYVNSLNGKVLRINPQNGNGYQSNPFYEHSNPKSAKSRVWSLGFRNPFRMSLKPNTGNVDTSASNPGTLFIGDVGFYTYEELNISDGAGQNFGWPKYEGMGLTDGYSWLKTLNKDYPNFFKPDWCGEDYVSFQNLVKTTNESHSTKFYYDCTNIELPDSVINFNHVRPALTYRNANSVENNNNIVLTPSYDNNGTPVSDTLGTQLINFESEPFTGISAVAGAFYDGEKFPEEYKSSFFMADFSGWIKRFDFNQNNELTNIHPFIDNAGAVVDIKSNPFDGCLYYIDIYAGEINKICFGGNRKPIAEIEASAYYGASPLEVSFSANKSYDPDGDDITYSWDFGNGESSIEETQTINFSEDIPGTPKSFMVTLTVEDELGAKDVKQQLISINNTPPSVTFQGADATNYYSSEDIEVFDISTSIEDQEHDVSEISTIWYLILHHNDHYHIESEFNAEDIQFSTAPIGCGVESYWYKTVFVATDPEGLSTTDTLLFYPDCISDTSPNTQKNIFLWPNPFDNLIVLQFKGVNKNNLSSLKLSNALGQQENLLPKASFFDDQVLINSKGMKSGFYILEAIINDEKYIKKISKL